MSNALNTFIYKGYKYEIIIYNLHLVLTKKDVKGIEHVIFKKFWFRRKHIEYEVNEK